MKKLILISLVFMFGCSVNAYRKGDVLTLKGYGIKSAEWNADGSAKIEKYPPFEMPKIELDN